MNTGPGVLAGDAHQAVELMVEVPPGKLIKYDIALLCSALGITDPTRVVVETDGSRHALVTIYPSNPLAEIRPVTRQDLLMDRHGRIAVGRAHNGRVVRRRLFDPASGRAQRFLLFGTTGAGKSRTLQIELIAEKLNGIVSWVGDLKHGASVPEAKDNVDWFATTPEEVILQLLAAVEVAQERMARYSALGRTAFMWNRPDPLLHVRIDEANRLLEKGAPYRDLATFLIRELGRTGGSVGVGVGLSAQASHLEELGGSDTLRAMLKEGEVTLLRWSSSMMRQLVADGLLPAGVQLMPIPKTLQTTNALVSQFDDVDDDLDAPGTQGTAYVLSSPHPTAMMRHWRVGSIAPLPGLDPAIIALYGDEDPARLEQASWDAAGEAYAARHDPDSMAALCAALADPPAPDESGASAGPTLPPGAPDPAAPARTSALLEDRITAALDAATAPMAADEVLAAVLADGGREVRLGSVRNTLGALADEEVIVRAGHGRYTSAS